MEVPLLGSTTAFQSGYCHANLPDKETKAQGLWLAHNYIASLTLTLMLFLLPRKEGATRKEMEEAKG